VLTYKRLERDLGPLDFNKYVTLNKGLLPEVFWEDGPPTWEQYHPKGGCPGLQVNYHLNVTGLFVWVVALCLTVFALPQSLQAFIGVHECRFCSNTFLSGLGL